MAQGGRPVLPLDGDRAQVEEHKWVVGPLSQLGLEDLAIALELPLPQRRVGVAGVPDGDLGPPHRDVDPPQRGQNLLVNRIPPARVLAHRTCNFCRLPSMTEDHRPEPGIDDGVPGMRRSDNPQSPVLLTPTSCNISDVPFSLPEVSTAVSSMGLYPAGRLRPGGRPSRASARRIQPSSLISKNFSKIYRVGPTDIFGMETPMHRRLRRGRQAYLNLLKESNTHHRTGMPN